MNILIRKLKQSDFDSWSGLWEQYLNYYKTQLSEEIYTTTFSRLINPDIINQNAFVAEVDGRLVGLVHYVYHDDNWRLEKTSYLQDLFASPDVRNLGIGRKLIEAVYQAVDENKTPSVYWLTEESNKTARKLYDRIAKLSPFVVYER